MGGDDPRAGGGVAPASGTWRPLVAICGATFMLLVDVTIVQVALPAIHRSLHADFTNLQWVISAYALTLSALILSWGSLSDRYGRKRIFTTGVLVFTFASLLCGLSYNSLMLDLARAAQGVGGAAMFATSLALIGQEYHGPARAKAIGMWGATVGVAVAVGPLVGGILTSGLGWRWIFFVNIPIGAGTIALAARYLVNSADPNSRSLDVAGLLTFSIALFALNFGLLQGTGRGWSSPLILAAFVTAGVLLFAFVLVEMRSPRAMFDLSLFRRRSFSGVSLATVAIGGGMFALFPYITFFLQNDLGYSALQGGIKMLPETLPAFVVPLAMRGVADKLPPGAVLGSGLVMVSGGLVTMAGLSSGSTWIHLLPGMLITGAGIGVCNPSIARTALATVDPARTGMASGISNTMRIGGLSIGIAGFGALFQARLGTGLASAFPGSRPGLRALVASGGPRAAAPITGAPGTTGFAHVLGAYAGGMNAIFLVGAAVTAVGAVIAYLSIRESEFVKMPAPAPAPDAPPVAGAKPQPT